MNRSLRTRPTAQWTGDNLAEIERLLREHLVRADKVGERCHLVGLGLNTALDLGDSVVLEGDRLGIIRATGPIADKEVTWTGANVQAMADFLRDYKVRVDTIGPTLHLYGGNDPKPLVLHRGDKLIERHGTIIISKAGVGHRV